MNRNRHSATCARLGRRSCIVLRTRQIGWQPRDHWETRREPPCHSALALFLIPWSPLHAQNAAIDDLKGKIFDARMAQQTFANGLKYCSELNGKSFYYQLRNRILNLEEYFRSLRTLVKAQVYNPDKRRRWTLQDAKERWEEVKNRHRPTGRNANSCRACRNSRNDWRSCKRPVRRPTKRNERTRKR